MWALLMACGASNTGFHKVPKDVVNEEGTGVAEIYPLDVTIPDCIPGVSNSAYMKVTNTGDNDLTVYNITVSDAGGGVFTLAPVGEFALVPGDTREWYVEATITSKVTSVDGELRVQTSDADALDARIPLHADAWSGDTADSG